MRPADWKELKAFAEHKGYAHKRTRGDHYIMNRSGSNRPVVIPIKKELREPVILGLIRTMGSTKSEFEEFLGM